MRNSNPTLSNSTFERFAQNGVFGGQAVAQMERMTVEGTVNKTLILLFLTIIAAGWSWTQMQNPAMIPVLLPMVFISALVALVVGLVTSFKPDWARFLAPVYALLEGTLLGAISFIVNQSYHGIATQAVGLTFGVMAVMLLVYRSGLIQVTDKLRIGIIAATGGVVLFGLVACVLSLFGHDSLYMARYSFYSTSPLAIGISLVVCAIAAFNLLLDFDFIERGAQVGAPKFMEWYGAFGLMVTLIWLYINVLRLLARLNSRR